MASFISLIFVIIGAFAIVGFLNSLDKWFGDNEKDNKEK